MIDEDALRVKYQLMAPTLDERSRRLLLGAEAHAGGRGAVAAVARATGASRSTVRRGREEVIALEGAPEMSGGGIRRPGGGRPTVVVKQPGLARALDALIEPTTRGDPECPLRWTTKSTRRLSAELGAQGDERITPWEWASKLDTIAYEITCGISARVPRTPRVTR